MNHIEEVAEMLNIKLDEEFYIHERRDYVYKLEKDVLMRKIILGYGGVWVSTNNTLLKLIIGDLTVKWQPKNGERYYFPTFYSPEGVDESVWINNKYDKSRLKQVGLYKEYKEAQEKARELGWLE